MPQREFQVEMVGIEYVCDKCADGTMECIKLDSTMGKFFHQCTNCGHTQHFDTKYPTTGYRKLS